MSANQSAPVQAPMPTRRPIGMAEPVMARMVATNIDQETTAGTATANFPAYSPTLCDGYAERAAGQVRAALPPPVDREFFTDGLALDNVPELTAEVSAKSVQADEALDEEFARDDRQAELPMPMSDAARQRFSTIVVFTVLGLMIGLAALFGISIDAFILGPVLEGEGFDGPQAPLGLSSMEWSLILGAAIAFTQLAKAAITLAAPRAVGIAGKCAYVIIDLALSATLYAMRSGTGTTGQGLSFTLAEFALSLTVSIVLMIAASHLVADDRRREAWSVAERKLQAAQRKRVIRTAARDEAATNLDAQIAVIEQREVANRMEGKLVDLAKTTAVGAYATKTAELVGVVADTATDAQITNTMSGYAEAEGRRIGIRPHNNHSRGATP